MDFPTNLAFNPKPPTIMHIDLNSCFATIEQQANRKFRGKPLAVAAYKSPKGCIVAPSIEAKKLGIKTGMRVMDGKMICPDLLVVEPDPWKYRNIHIALRKILSTYTEDIEPKSIDEFILNLEGFPSFKKGIQNVAAEIKYRIKKDVGDYLTVSIGIAPNRFLAKTAAGLKKPDGLETIDSSNYLDVYSKLALYDLCGIKTNNIVRLNKSEIYTVLDFYTASAKTLHVAFHSIVGYYWYMRLKGWEPDDVVFGRHSYGNSVALHKPLTSAEELSPVLMKLVEKMSRRMRHAGYVARGVHVSMLYRSGTHWHQGMTVADKLFAPGDIYRLAYKLMCHSPYKLPVHTLAVSCFNLIQSDYNQLDMFDDVSKKKRLTDAIDTITDKWGNFVITPAQMLNTKDIVKDRVAFGNIKELEEFMFRS